jgi:hypothetical protein
MSIVGGISPESDSWDVERRSDGAVIVRVQSRAPVEPPLPDAVFTFREGDPQFEYWQERYFERRGVAE